MCILPTETGRIALVNGVLTRTVDGDHTEGTVDPAEEPALLAELFGVVLTAETEGAAGADDSRSGGRATGCP